MRFYALTILLVVLFTVPAFATTYIDVEAYDAGATYCVGKVYDSGGERIISVFGDVEFTVEVSESYAYDIDTCWITFNGSTSTGTTRNITVTDYRTHYGAVVIKYTDNTYESYEFHVYPHWDLTAIVAKGAQPPATCTYPSDPRPQYLQQVLCRVILRVLPKRIMLWYVAEKMVAAA